MFQSLWMLQEVSVFLCVVAPLLFFCQELILRIPNLKLKLNSTFSICVMDVFSLNSSNCSEQFKQTLIERQSHFVESFEKNSNLLEINKNNELSLEGATSSQEHVEGEHSLQIHKVQKRKRGTTQTILFNFFHSYHFIQ